MCDHYKSMQYLTVNAEEYMHRSTSIAASHKRLSRSVSPALPASASAAFDEAEMLASKSELRIPSPRRKSLLSVNTLKTSSSDSSCSNSLKNYKSSESLFTGRARKQLHRRALFNEIYRKRCNTDPGLKPQERRQLTIPILSIPVEEASLEKTSTTTTTKTRKRHRIRSGSVSALGSLIQQTVKLSSAPVGLRTAASEERLSQYSSKPLNEDVKRQFSRSTSSVSTLAYTTPDASMAPLQSHAEAHSVTCLTTLAQDSSPTQQQQQQQQQQQNQKRQLCQQISTSGSNQSGYSSANSSVNECYPNSINAGQHNKAEAKSLKHSASSSLNQLVPLASSASIRSISPSRKSERSSGGNTAKHDQSSAAAATAAATSTPPEKEKKRKEVSSSRVKKFHRHFSQVSKDEKLINYFSCALVSDILLQGHLYITDQHFAFYSNVFGYVTKVVIPTSSVTKISKEKTAKIIPNAVGVATADERHVFGSFISREAAFRLMCSVCLPLAPAEILLPKAPADIEISEEYSIEDESSCSISGNESSPHAAATAAAAAASAGDTSHSLLRRTVVGSSLNLGEGKKISTEKLRHSDIPTNAKSTSSAASNTPPHQSIASRASAPASSTLTTPPTPLSFGLGPNAAAILLSSTPTTGAAASSASNLTMIIAGTASSTTSASSTPTVSTSSSPTTVAAAGSTASKSKSAAQVAAESFKTLGRNALLRLKFPSELHVVYLGVLLAVVLALFSVFLLYRILDIEAKAGLYRSSATEFNWRSGNDEDIFAEALRWQKQLQTKSTEEAQSILNTNLEQIAKVRRSLETLSMLIHDRSAAFATANSDDNSD